MVRILALETSELTGSVAAAVDNNLLAEKTLEPGQRSAQSLAPAIRLLLEDVGWQPRDVELVAVTTGPGSFTGLRVGVATAKLFAYAVGAQVLGVSTLEAIAIASPVEIVDLSVAVDAQRGDVVAQDFRRDASGVPAPTGRPRLTPIERWLGNLTAGSCVLGPILKRRHGALPAGVRPLDPRYWHPTAAAVARLAFRDHLAGRRDDLWNLMPVYSRPSAAEEKRAGKESPS